MSHFPLQHRPLYAAVFYRDGQPARTFRFRRFTDALACADRFSERLNAACMIHELPRLHQAPAKPYGVLHVTNPDRAAFAGVESPALIGGAV